MSDTHSLYGQKIQQLLDDCPLGKEAPGVSAHLTEEQRRQWCRWVAKWTDDVRGDSAHAPTGNDLMNWYIRRLQRGQPARDSYEKMFSILEGGYELIRDRGDRSRWLEVPAFGRGSPGTTRKLKANEFAAYAISEIKSRFTDPLEVCLGQFPRRYSSEVDPIIMPQVNDLWLALDDFRTHFEQAGVTGREIRFLRTWRHDPDFLGVRIRRRHYGEGPRTPFENATARDRPDGDERQIDNFIEEYDSVPDLYSDLMAQISRDDEMRPEPWIWLGINLLASSNPPQGQVFDSLIPSSSQINMGTRIVFSPDYLQLLCNALTCMKGVAGKRLGQPGRTKAKRIRRKSPALTPLERDVWTLYIENRWKLGEIASYRNCTIQNVSKALKKAERKVNNLNSRSIAMDKARRLSEDKRGQVDIAAEDESFPGDDI